MEGGAGICNQDVSPGEFQPFKNITAWFSCSVNPSVVKLWSKCTGLYYFLYQFFLSLSVSVQLNVVGLWKENAMQIIYSVMTPLQWIQLGEYVIMEK